MASSRAAQLTSRDLRDGRQRTCTGTAATARAPVRHSVATAIWALEPKPPHLVPRKRLPRERQERSGIRARVRRRRVDDGGRIETRTRSWLFCGRAVQPEYCLFVQGPRPGQIPCSLPLAILSPSVWLRSMGWLSSHSQHLDRDTALLWRSSLVKLVLAYNAGPY